MAELWPEGVMWPTEYREHALKLMKYLLEIRGHIDRTGSQTVPAEVAKMMIQGATSFVAKAQNIPDMTAIHGALREMREDAKAMKEETSQRLETLKKELRGTNTQIERIAAVGEETKGAAKEAMEVGKVGVAIMRDVKNTNLQNNKSAPMSYAAAVASGTLASSMHVPYNTQTASTQSQREIIVNIRNPVTIERLRAMNPRHLKSHVDRALEQSTNQQIAEIKIMSANQLKSGDLVVRTASVSETQILQQHSEEWARRVGEGASVRVPAYGVIVHSIRTHSIDMDKFTDNRDEILHENRPFIPRAEIKYIGWLTRSGAKKSTTSIIIEFARPEDANKIISEGLVWHGELCQCERNPVQDNNEMWLLCSGAPIPGLSLEEGARRTQECPTRQEEMARAKAAYATRAPFYPVPASAMSGTPPGSNGTVLRRKRSARGLGLRGEERPQGELGSTGSGLKRANTGSGLGSLDKENEPPTGPGSQRPQRTYHPTRKALASLHVNGMGRNSSQQMDIEYNVRKSRDTVMATLLRDAKIGDFDVLAIQEPWNNPFTNTTHHPAKDIFHLCYAPNDAEGRPTRVCFFVHKQLDHAQWRFDRHSEVICSLTFQFGDDETPRSLEIVNIYNPPRSTENRTSVLPFLRRLLERSTANERMVIGDFNLHHSLWGGEHIVRPDAEAIELIEIMEQNALQSTFPSGTITYEEGSSRTTIDLCLATIGLMDRVVRSQVDHELDHDSDHLPIATTIDLQLPRRTETARRNWKRLDEKQYREILEETLPPLQRPRTKAALDRYVEQITTTINEAVDWALPKTMPSSRMRQRWNEQCSEVLAEAKRLKRRLGREHTDDDWEAYRTARNKKTRVIRKALRQAHRDRVEEASQSPQALWKLAK
ncbi:hypothetical protein CBER1_07390 [Cercospora berteroae]|uniref:Endonuclease/exonuclease/phosphatase domain-containing protein n=1 Tax=Cercospora berteroae TaxID=357750 RepID=A0A2S6CMV9_9PEZI|nr:hypothetical protein CBER1_07390 [Cercospora berteroae]